MRTFLLIAFFCGIAQSAFAQSFSDIKMPRGFTALELPADFGGLSLAGALVQISREKGFRYLGHLSDCGLPKRALEVMPSIGPDANISRREVKVEVGIGAKILKFFSLGVKSEKVAQVKITLGLVTDEMVIPIAVLSAARNHEVELRERCGSFLKAKNVFWINNALKAEEVKLELLDSNGLAVEGGFENLDPSMPKLEANADFRLESTGVIRFNRPLYIAFRDAPPSELLTGDISLFSKQGSTPEELLIYGDEVLK